MNIFVLDNDPVVAAQMQCDKHVVKMCLESAQMLSTVAGGPYKPTHAKHPCTVWAGKTLGNFRWLKLHGLALCDEYSYRYGKQHKCRDIIANIQEPLFNDAVLTPFALAMPIEHKQEDAVKAYRSYYKSKQIDMRYTKRPQPEWLLIKESK